MTEQSVQIVAAFFLVLFALAGAAMILRPFYMPLWHLFRGTQQFLEDWFGEPARMANGREIAKAKPGAMARLAQLENNGGESIKDKVDKIHIKIDATQQAANSARDLAARAVEHAESADADARLRMARVQHDLTNVRTGQEFLLERQDDVERRLDAMDKEHLRHTDAIGAALVEQVEVAITAEEKRG